MPRSFARFMGEEHADTAFRYGYRKGVPVKLDISTPHKAGPCNPNQKSMLRLLLPCFRAALSQECRISDIVPDVQRVVKGGRM